ncbi:MAG: sigma-70 family RNA polymerase sigma factor [Cellulosilyticum sp.]|nr:sigma-70 family RNA polymerase sigma factor [Cellulosilyticum sp.]
MKEEQWILVTSWWNKLSPFWRKFVRETHLEGMEKEDIEQECFLQLLRALEKFKPEMGVPFWSYYKIMMYGWRANQNRVKARMELAFGEDEMFFLADDRVNIEKDAERKWLIEEVLRKIDTLDELEKEIISAYYFQNKKLTQIASHLHMPLKNIEYRKRKALHMLKEQLS